MVFILDAVAGSLWRSSEYDDVVGRERAAIVKVDPAVQPDLPGQPVVGDDLLASAGCARRFES